jgi:hypothetical protein
VHCICAPAWRTTHVACQHLIYGIDVWVCLLLDVQPAGLLLDLLSLLPCWGSKHDRQRAQQLAMLPSVVSFV